MNLNLGCKELGSSVFSYSFIIRITDNLSLKLTNSEKSIFDTKTHRIGLKRMSVNNASSYQFDFVSFIILMYNMVLLTVYREDSKVLFICVSFCLLAHESCDISQAETKITLVKSLTNTQNDNHFHSKL